MKNLILTSVIVLLSVLTTSLFGQEKIEKLTIKIHNKNTYFVPDTLSNPHTTIKKDKLPALFGEIDATLIVDLKNKKVTIVKTEKDNPSYDGVYKKTSPIISYTQKGNIITYHKKSITWEGTEVTVHCTINLKKNTFEQLTYYPYNWQSLTTPEEVALKIN